MYQDIESLWNIVSWMDHELFTKICLATSEEKQTTETKARSKFSTECVAQFTSIISLLKKQFKHRRGILVTAECSLSFDLRQLKVSVSLFNHQVIEFSHRNKL
jgi:hypothetical protein